MSIWKPTYTGKLRGYRAIGYYATRNYSSLSGTIIAPNKIFEIGSSNKLIVTDKGSGGRSDVSHWNNDTKGVIFSTAKPNYDNNTSSYYYLPKKNVTNKEFTQIWTDKGTGANTDHCICIDEFGLYRARTGYGDIWDDGIKNDSVIRL
ncbi:hypothetical protein M0812_17754 [Anaeramoeba flamelloides]|uniref:Uncharacterized protein n=1 Tax=Anaeramoeba flamelloides TaxID=1746091 RepID=A0AAV7Z456_9EUKA|nr:hypothetical protein M0812_17754 [Anaeramoeba flamelloides]